MNEETVTEVKSELIVIAKHDSQYGDAVPLGWMLTGAPEEFVADWVEADATQNYFFLQVTTDISMETMSPEEYQVIKDATAQAEQEAASEQARLDRDARTEGLTDGS